MVDLGQRIREARRHVDVDWSPDRAHAAEQGLAVRRAARARKRGALGATTAALVALLFVLVVRGRADQPLVAEARVAAAAAVFGAGPMGAKRAPVKLDDGSIIRPSAGAVVLASATTKGRVEYDIAKGGASFDVTHDEARVFRVTAGGVAVEVLGTAFSVERIADKVAVAVDRGRVRVRWGDEQRELGVGERGVFPPDASADGRASTAPTGDAPRAPERATAAVHGADAATASPPVDAPPSSAAPVAPATWSALAKAGDYDKAYEALHDASSAPPRDVPEELLLAADVARLSGHPAQAVDPLRRVARDHRGDPRAALAAFTLGRVLLDSLGRPREAADAFADARALGGGGLGEEALAREVEARSRAGDGERARTLAEQYVARFPDGKRTRAVKKFGGLE